MFSSPNLQKPGSCYKTIYINWISGSSACDINSRGFERVGVARLAACLPSIQALPPLILTEVLPGSGIHSPNPCAACDSGETDSTPSSRSRLDWSRDNPSPCWWLVGQRACDPILSTETCGDVWDRWGEISLTLTKYHRKRRSFFSFWMPHSELRQPSCYHTGGEADMERGRVEKGWWS